MEKHHELGPIWLENTDQPTHVKVLERLKEAQNNEIQKKKNGGQAQVEFSLNLVKVLEKRYKNQEIDIWAQA